MWDKITRRATVRVSDADPADGYFFPVPAAGEPLALPPGGDEMSVVLIGRLRVVPASTGVVIVSLKSPTDGYQLVIGALGNQFAFSAFPGVFPAPSPPFAVSPDYDATMIDTLMRVVCVASVARDEIIVYLNGVPGVAAQHSAQGVEATDQSVLNYDPLPIFPVTDFDVIDLAVIQTRAFTAAEVAELDADLVAVGRITDSFAVWDCVLRAERLVVVPDVWDISGKRAGTTAPLTGAVVVGSFDTET